MHLARQQTLRHFGGAEKQSRNTTTHTPPGSPQRAREQPCSPETLPGRQRNSQTARAEAGTSASPYEMKGMVNYSLTETVRLCEKRFYAKPCVHRNKTVQKFFLKHKQTSSIERDLLPSDVQVHLRAHTNCGLQANAAAQQNLFIPNKALLTQSRIK